jgi:hypothetical protein
MSTPAPTARANGHSELRLFVQSRPDGPSEQVVQAADEIIAALFVTPLHRKFTLSDLGEFDPCWWPTTTHRCIVAAVGELYLRGQKVTPHAIEKLSEGVIRARTIREMIESTVHADFCDDRFAILKADFERRTWERTKQAIRLAMDRGATRADVLKLLGAV